MRWANFSVISSKQTNKMRNTLLIQYTLTPLLTLYDQCFILLTLCNEANEIQACQVR